MSIARRVLPSKLELKRRDGSGMLAPRANVSFTTFLYVSPVQTIPLCDQTGTPTIPFDGFLHFRSSIISGSASKISARMLARVWSRQSPKSRVGWSMRREAESLAFGGDLDLLAALLGMFERDVPAVGGPITPTPGGNPAFCGPGEIRCFADEWSLANYVLKQFSKTNYLSIRNEVLADLKGQRTGFKTTYSEHELMWGHWIGNTVLFRPGIRYEHSYGVSAYDSGTEQTQFSFAMDVVFRY